MGTKLIINTNKTKIMVFEKGRTTSPKLCLKGIELEVVSSFKYLGVELFKNGNWFRTQKYIAQHAEYSLHRLYNVFNRLTLPISEKCKLFDSVVGSVLNYASEVWWFHDAPHVEQIHTKFCRNVLCVRKSTNLDALYGELGRYTLNICRKFRMLKYWEKILTNRDSLPHKIYLKLLLDCNNNNSLNGMNWAFHVKTELDKLGFSDVWQNQLRIDIPLKQIKLRILDQFKQQWYSRINNSNRLETYSRIKI